MLAKLSLFALLSAAVLATPLRDARAPAAALDERAVAVTAGDLANFEYYVQVVAATSCNSEPGAPITCSADACPDLQANDAKIVTTFSGYTTGIEGLVALDPVRQLIIVVILGSINVRNWITDFVFVFEDCDLVEDCKAHAGFLTAWKEVKGEILDAVNATKTANPSYTVVAVGHSLGGAVITIAGAYLRLHGYPLDIYTFGSPRVGNEAFATFVTAQSGAEYRLTHVDDPIPRQPPLLFGYRHTSPEYWLSTGNATTINYSLDEIKVCEGFSNTDCNAGTTGLDTEAHVYYLRATRACKPDKG
ncbi:lipase [Colletotrichum graminicola]|uniref:Lipase n=1 Tax=Colletotrichum graminicola (strain M1.001 / M2 / FGSC 10212) TaxID=645133 RepID=E3QS83_COLGM|nr:lipase [Colletotrichum graminicola M1.001]EFQ33710.1 lipase [Colletotrichum graminicola M1.001]WDK20966.1 lipase [Colletotrichum graminicola]